MRQQLARFTVSVMCAVGIGICALQAIGRAGVTLDGWIMMLVGGGAWLLTALLIGMAVSGDEGV